MKNLDTNLGGVEIRGGFKFRQALTPPTGADKPERSGGLAVPLTGLVRLRYRNEDPMKWYQHHQQTHNLNQLKF